jgi:short-subunit dehydrogenase
VIGWVVGVSGTWGGAVGRELLERGFDLVALGRTEPADLATRAAELGRSFTFVHLDLASPDEERAPIVEDALAVSVPDVLVVASAATGVPRASLAQLNYLAPAALIEQVAEAMRGRGSGRIGVFVGQNARLGMAGAGEFSASQAALWTWCEGLQDELRRELRPISPSGAGTRPVSMRPRPVRSSRRSWPASAMPVAGRSSPHSR